MSGRRLTNLLKLFETFGNVQRQIDQRTISLALSTTNHIVSRCNYYTTSSTTTNRCYYYYYDYDDYKYNYQ